MLIFSVLEDTTSSDLLDAMEKHEQSLSDYIQWKSSSSAHLFD